MTPVAWMYEGGDLAPGRHFLEKRQPGLEGGGVKVTPLCPCLAETHPPVSADQAEAMLKMGWMWLVVHAPERINEHFRRLA